MRFNFRKFRLLLRENNKLFIYFSIISFVLFLYLTESSSPQIGWPAGSATEDGDAPVPWAADADALALALLALEASTRRGGTAGGGPSPRPTAPATSQVPFCDRWPGTIQNPIPEPGFPFVGILG